MCFKKMGLILLAVILSNVSYAGTVKMCEQSEAEDPSNFMQFALDQDEELLIFISLDGKVRICEFEKVSKEAGYTHSCEFEISETEIVDLNINFTFKDLIYIKEFSDLNGPYHCRD